MVDSLADALRSEIPCDSGTAALLASLAREYLTRFGGGPEDSDADIIIRLRDPRWFGVFAESALGDRRVGSVARQAILERVFDLLPLPRSEGDLVDVDSRAPPHLLALALRLVDSEGLTVLHVMHLVYAVFLDRSLVTNAPRRARGAVYDAILAVGDANEDLRLLYAGFHLAAIPESEAAADLKRSLRSNGLGPSLRQSLASAASTWDGGRLTLVRAAQREGLIARELSDPQSPAILANVPRLPESLRSVGQQYLNRAVPR